MKNLPRPATPEEIRACVGLPADVVHTLALRDIDFDPKFNTRSAVFRAPRPSVTGPGDGMAPGDLEDDEGPSYTKTLISIAQRGQDTPITVRPHPAGEHASHRYACVTGFTRGAIVRELGSLRASDADYLGVKGSPLVGIPNPTIKAFIQDLDEGAALELNLRENFARINPTAADLAFGIGRLATLYPKRGLRELAAPLGISTTHVHHLLLIMRGFEAEVLVHWRGAANTGTSPLGVTVLCDMLRLPEGGARTKAYYAACAARRAKKAASKTRSRGGDRVWIQESLARAEELGVMMGELERAGFLSRSASGRQMIETIIRLRDTSHVQESHWIHFATVFEDAWRKGLGVATPKRSEPPRMPALPRPRWAT